MKTEFRCRTAAFLIATVMISQLAWPMPTARAETVEEQNKNIAENILTRLGDFDYTRLKKFLQSQEGPLKKKDYLSEFIWNAKSYSRPNTINARILIVFMELKSGAITNKNFNPDNIAKIMDVSDEELNQLVKEKAKEAAFKEPNERRANTLYHQLGWLAIRLMDAFYSDGKYFKFQDGSRLEASKEINKETYAIEQVLAEIAPDRETWEKWISKDEGSFYTIYKNWFGDPMAEPLKMANETETTPFVERPFAGNKIVPINSFFDHKYPQQSGEDDNGGDAKRNIMVRFSGDELPSSTSGVTLGVNSYSGHEGYDYQTGSGMEIFAAANGTIESLYKNDEADSDSTGKKVCDAGTENECCDENAYGCNIILSHDINNDSVIDFFTRYAHLDYGSIPESFKMDDVINVQTLVGRSDNTGSSTGAHLHFDMENGSNVNSDPFGWWGTSSDPWSSRGTSSRWLWKTDDDLEVDTKSNSFQNFYNVSSGAVWGEETDQNGYKSYWAHIRNTTDQNEVKWAFWVVNIPETGKYTISAKIPQYVIAGKTVTDKAKYEIYQMWNQEVIKETKTIDQSKANNGWVEIGTFSFEKGPHAAVRLSNISTETDENEILWADAVKWEKVKEKMPELSFVNDSVAMTDSGSGQYQISFQIKNDGNADAENIVVCFGNAQEKCLGQTSITRILQGQTSEKTKIRFSGYTVPSQGDIGTLRIYSQNPEDSNTSNDTLAVSREKLVVSTPPGGVDFSAIDLSGFEITGDAIDLVIQAVEGSGGGEDVEENKDMLKKVFLTALTVPNDRQWVSMGKGEVSIQSPMEKTELGNIMLESDLALKYDMAEEMIPRMSTLYGDWKNMVVASAFWKEMKSKGFNSYPYFQGSIVVVPGSVAVNETEGKLMVTTSELKLESRLDYFAIETSAYRLSSEAENEIKKLLNQWQTKVETSLAEAVRNLEGKIQTDDSYREIRKAFPVVALAHWYKTLSRENLPYEELIDTNNIAGLERETPFDEAYWESQSWQALGTFDVLSYYGSTYRATWYGAVELSAASSETDGPLTEREEEIFRELMENFSYVKESDQYFLNAGSMKKSGVDLSGYLEFQDPYLYTGKNATIGLRIVNGGDQAVAGNFQYVLFEKVTTEDGGENTYILDKTTLGGLSAVSTYEKTISWKIPEIVGSHEFTLEIDASGAVSEDVESNNTFTQKFEIESPYPHIEIIAPEEGAYMAGSNAKFTAIAEDPQEGLLDGEALEWRSDIDGLLGSGGIITVKNLSIGSHIISVKAVDGDGFFDEKTVPIYVPEPGLPDIRIKAPSENEKFPVGREVAFTAEAVDYEDGDIAGSQIIWESDLDGLLGVGEWLNVGWLREGEHTITVTAFDFDGNVVEKNIHIVIEKGIPALSIIQPIDETTVFEHENVTLEATASDLQDGDMGNVIEWRSSRDDLLGKGAKLAVTLSAGEHTITASVRDKDGENEEESRFVTILHTPPTIDILAPSNGAEFDYFDEIFLQASATDIQDGELGDEAITWQSSLNGYLGRGKNITVSKLLPGDHMITAKAVDSDEAASEKTINIRIILDPPTVTIDEPSDKAVFYVGQEITFSGQAEDQKDGTITGNALTWYSNRDGEFAQGENISFSGLSEGTHTIELRAKDSDGWVGIDSRTITVLPNSFPKISVMSPSAGETFVHGDTVMFRAQATDAEDGTLGGNSIQWESSRDGHLGVGERFELATLSLGEHKITLSARDRFGVETKATLPITIADRPTEITIIAPDETHNIFSSNGTVKFTATADDLEDGNISRNILWTSNINGEMGRGGEITVEGTLSSGTHTLTASVTDTVGNVSQDSVSIRVVDPTNELVTVFSDGEEKKTFQYSSIGGSQGATLKLPADGKVTTAQMDIFGKEAISSLNEDAGYSSGIERSVPAFADIDADSDRDLLIGTAEGKMKLYRNEGGAERANFVLESEDYGGIFGDGQYIAPALIDIDANASLDLFTGKDDGTINFYRNTGTQTEPVWNLESSKYADIDVGNWAVPAFIDIDADTDLDLFISSYEGPISFYRNDGNKQNPVWTKITSHPLSSAYHQGGSLTFANIDADNDQDLIIGQSDSRIYEYRNDGNVQNPIWNVVTANLANFYSGKKGADSYPAPALLDSDGDGDLDLFFGERDGNINISENTGSASAPQWTSYRDTLFAIDVGYSAAPVFADIDADSDLDLIIGEEQNSSKHSNETLNFYRNEGGNWKWETGNFAAKADQWIDDPAPVFVDIDGDTDLDLFVGQWAGWLVFFQNDGNADEPIWTMITNKYQYIDVGEAARPAFADIDADGDFDLFIGNRYGTIYFYQNNEINQSPIWTFVTDQYADITLDWGGTSPVFTDIDTDGDLDLFVGRTSQILWYENIGDAKNPAWQLKNEAYGGSIELSGSMPAFADTDNDGDMDLYIGDAAGGLNVLSQRAPQNPRIFIEGNRDLWNFSGEFHDRQTTTDFSEILETYLRSQTADTDGFIEIPFAVSSEGAGMLEISNLNIQYAKEDLEPPQMGAASFADSGFVTPNPLYAGSKGHVGVHVTDNQGIESVTLEWLGETRELSSAGGGIYEGEISAPVETGKYPLTVKASDQSGLSAEIKEEVKVIADGIDLEISNMITTPESAEEGQKMVIEATVENFGATETEFFIELVKDEEFLERKTVFIAGSSSETVQFEWNAKLPAENVKIILDPENAIQELRETNNIAIKSVSVKDVTAPSMEVVAFPDFAWTDESMQAELVANDDSGVASVELLLKDNVYTLIKDGELGKYIANIPPLPAGAYEAKFTAKDANGLLTSEMKTVEIANIMPDIEIAQFASTAESPETITALIKNTGRGAAENIQVTITENGNELPDGQRYITLAGGAENTLTFSPEQKIGSRNIEIIADSNNRIVEGNETNNRASLILTSLTIEQVTIADIEKPDYLVEDENFTLKVALDETGLKSLQDVIPRVSITTENEIFDLMYNENSGRFETPFSFPENGKSEMIVKAETNDGFYQYFEGLNIHASKPDIILTLKSADEPRKWILNAENAGGASVENLNVSFMVDGKILQTQTVSQMDRGEMREVTFDWDEEDGSHNLVFQADPENAVDEDNEENNMIARIVEVADTVAPSLLEIVAEGNWYEGSNAYLKVQASDNTKIEQVTARLLDGGQTAVLNTISDGWYEGAIAIPAGVSGEKQLLVSVKDAEGLEASVSMEMEIFSQQSDIEIVKESIVPESLIAGQQTDLSVQFKNRGGSDSGIFTVRLEINGVVQDEKEISLSGGEETAVPLKYVSPEGTYTVKVIADSENEEKELKAFDLTPPETPEIVFASEGWIQSDAVVSWKAVNQAEEYWYQVDEGTWENIGKNLSMTLSDLSDGKHRVGIVAKDMIGNESSASTADIFIDKTAPETPVIAPWSVGSGWQRDGLVRFTWDIPRDQGSGAVRYEGILDDEEINVGESTFFQTELASGIHSVKIRAVDAGGNIGEWSEELEIKIDVDAPTKPEIWSETHRDSEKAEANRTPEFQWETQEDVSGIAGFFYLFTNNPDSDPAAGGFWIENTENPMRITIAKIPTPFETEGIPDGVWYFHLRAKDNAGNISERSTYKITVQGENALRPWQQWKENVKIPDAAKKLGSW